MIEHILVSLIGAGSFVGTELAKEAVKRYAPKVLEQVDVVIDRVWELVSSGRIDEATREVAAAQLAPAMEAAVAALHRDTIVLAAGEQTNEYVTRARHLEAIIARTFEISRRWNTDLLLPGGLSADCALTLFKTQLLPECKFRLPEWDVGFAVQGEDRSMFIIPKQAVPASPTDWVEQARSIYRDNLVRSRTRTSEYFGLRLTWLGDQTEALYPAMFATGAHLLAAKHSKDQFPMIGNPYYEAKLAKNNQIELDLGSWRSGVDAMAIALRDMTGWLQLSDRDERLALQLNG